jgi:hypothetical protein
VRVGEPITAQTPTQARERTLLSITTKYAYHAQRYYSNENPSKYGYVPNFRKPVSITVLENLISNSFERYVLDAAVSDIDQDLPVGDAYTLGVINYRHELISASLHLKDLVEPCAPVPEDDIDASPPSG